jgi:DNA adenine methylase
MRVRSIFRYPGSKNRLEINQSILSFFPKDILEYREPFVGSGGLYFSQNRYNRRWINDLDSGLISVYHSMVESPGSFISSCREIPNLKEDSLCLPLLEEKFDYFLGFGEMSSLGYFFLNRLSWGGRVRRGLTYMSYPEGWNITRRNGYLEKVSCFMEGTCVSNVDYNELLTAEGEGLFFYLDPPYWNDTCRARTSKFYDNSFSEDDHVLLRDRLRGLSHRFCLSYDDCEFIRDLYKGFRIYESSWTYNISTENRRKGRELIILNYDKQDLG